jgi:anti-sigma B factor antagonist
MSSVHPLLTIKVADEPDAYVIRVAGELDLPGCSDLEAALAEAERSRGEQIVVDLDGLRFIDACGLHTLLAASRRSASNGSRLRLTRGTGEVARMFRLTLLDLTLPFTDPVEAHASSMTPERVGK